jgi:hypothetical protein
VRQKVYTNGRYGATTRVARFFWTQFTKRGKIYRTITKLPNVLNGRNIFQIAEEYTYQPFSFQGPQKFTQIRIFRFENIPSGNPALEFIKNTFSSFEVRHFSA